MASAETPLFTQTFDFLTWLLPITNHFPRTHRHTFTRRLLVAAFNLRKELKAATQHLGNMRLAGLRVADEALDRVRLCLCLAARFQAARSLSHQTPERMAAFTALATEFGLSEYGLHRYSVQFGHAWLGKYLRAVAKSARWKVNRTLPAASGVRTRCAGWALSCRRSSTAAMLSSRTACRAASSTCVWFRARSPTVLV